MPKKQKLIQSTSLISPEGSNNCNKESPFLFDELFISRTDARGIIISGNTIFQRVSQYGWDELIGKPHNIIRHQDMPKGVFYLFWDFLKRGKPIGAYVKNRAKDGSYYWVFAIATPVEGGYISIRLKPSSEIFQAVKAEYSSILEFEKDNKLKLQESVQKLLTDLKSLKFDSYEEFMSVALTNEIVARDEKLANPKDKLIEYLGEMMVIAKSIMSETDKIQVSYQENKYVPINLQIQSFLLGSEGKAVGVISNDYNIVSIEIKDEIEQFSKTANEVYEKICKGQFMLCMARIQNETVEFFSKENMDALNKKMEMDILRVQQQISRQEAVEGLKSIFEIVIKFQDDCNRIKKCASSLEVIRIMCKVNVSIIKNEGLKGLINDLKMFQTTISETLLIIEQLNIRTKQRIVQVIEAIKI